MKLMVLHTLMPTVGLLCACLIPRWRVSVVRVLLIGLATLVFAVLMVNLLVMFEALIENGTLERPAKSNGNEEVDFATLNYGILLVAAVPQMFLYCFMALMVARFDLRRRSRASHDLSTPEPATS